jgi:hypothetical protein
VLVSYTYTTDHTQLVAVGIDDSGAEISGLLPAPGSIPAAPAFLTPRFVLLYRADDTGDAVPLAVPCDLTSTLWSAPVGTIATAGGVSWRIHSKYGESVGHTTVADRGSWGF